MSSAQGIEAADAGHHNDWPVRLMGMIVFATGIGLLLLVFSIAYHLFTAAPATALGITITGDPKHDPGAMLIGQSFGFLIIKILLLFVMSAAASLISQKGVNLYFTCSQATKAARTVKPAASVSAEA